MTNKETDFSHIINGDMPVKMYFNEEELSELQEFMQYDHEDGSDEQAYAHQLAAAYYVYAVEYGHDDYTYRIQSILDSVRFKPSCGLSSESFYKYEGTDRDEYWNERDIFEAIIEARETK